MLRIDEKQAGEEQQKQEQPAQVKQGLVPQNATNLDHEDEGEEQDNFVALKAQAWGRMVPGQMSQHLSA